MALKAHPVSIAAATALAAALAVFDAGAASAQTMNTNSAAFNAGFGRTAGEENRPVNVGLTDANGNFTVINGVVQAPAGSIFGEVRAAAAASVSAGFSFTSGAGDSFTGAGSGSSASVVGNNLNVVVQGNNNTVIVNSTQTNTGALSATSTVNGKP
jgi:holdfast attachment protein HfaA